ncbi:auxin-responsive protein SAUR32-like [Solanum dulcamara]|uniref:auxin-responsive protein SAUR32-like n=1 Tax=Solanum dulcamara TaxID=45834 RepID=UPI0024866DB1|nr:auxin-responsive protein SAUR32-like [Solanum dulcamara]
MNMENNIPSNNLVRSSNKIRQIVRLQQLLKKWKKIAAASPSSTHLQRNNSINKFLKKTLSFSDKDHKEDNINNNVHVVPKGCLAVLCVGKEGEEKRFVIPMSYLAHHSFQLLLREAEEEFGFQQQGILKVPCQVSLFQNILKTIQYETPLPPPSKQPNHDDINNDDNIIHNVGCCSPENHQQHIMPPQMCTT